MLHDGEVTRLSRSCLKLVIDGRRTDKRQALLDFLGASSELAFTVFESDLSLVLCKHTHGTVAETHV